jgi:CHAD domain-containing protein
MARPWPITDLDPGDILRVSVHKIVRTRFRETFSYEQETLLGENEEALHDMRVSARRLRAILRIFRDCFPPKQFRKQGDKLRTLLETLGAVRDCDVFIRFLREKRAGLTPEKIKIVDLLLARELSERERCRRQLSAELRLLQKMHYPDSFMQFLSDAL